MKADRKDRQKLSVRMTIAVLKPLENAVRSAVKPRVNRVSQRPPGRRGTDEPDPRAGGSGASAANQAEERD